MLFSSVIPDDKDIMMVDQLLPHMNLKRYLRYLNNNIQVVIVDRDPRDVFVLDKYVWKDGILPSDVDIFCNWFLYNRSHRKIENLDTEQIKFIKFEDLIYRYEETTSKLAGWLGLDKKDHISKKEIFRPDVSINNTQTWKKHPESVEEVK